MFSVFYLRPDDSREFISLAETAEHVLFLGKKFSLNGKRVVGVENLRDGTTREWCVFAQGHVIWTAKASDAPAVEAPEMDPAAVADAFDAFVAASADVADSTRGYIGRAANARSLAEAAEPATKTLLLKLAGLWEKLAGRTKASLAFALCYSWACCIMPAPACMLMVNCPHCDHASCDTAASRDARKSGLLRKRL